MRWTTDREAALTGADYAINMIQVGGYKPATVIDFEIPKKYGLRQTIGDTLGIGGIMRALRTIPVLLDMARDMERLCPEVTHLNYVNPMVMNCMALDRGSSIKTVGLCHSVPHTASELAKDLGLPFEEVDYLVAGINHMAFYLKLEHNGQDLYPRLREVLKEGRMPAHNRVRYEMFGRLGYFVTESSEHFSEYTPWFIKRDRSRAVGALQHPFGRIFIPLRGGRKELGIYRARVGDPRLAGPARITTHLRGNPAHADHDRGHGAGLRAP